MSAATLLAALAAIGITYDWQPVEDSQGGHECVVAVQPELAPGQGGGEMVSETKMVPLRHLVAKPVFDEEPVKHTVYQQTYPPQPPSNPNDLYQGFQEYNNPAPRKSIGTELVRGGEKIVDGTGNVLRNTGEAIEGTARNLRDGFRSVLTPGYNQPQQPVAATQPGVYQPYNYNQTTTTAQPYGVQPSYPPVETTAGTITSTPPTPTQYSGQTQYGGQTQHSGKTQSNATTTRQQPGYGQTPQTNWNSTAANGRQGNQYATPTNHPNDRYTPPQNGRDPDAFVNLVDPRNSTASGSMVNLRNNQLPSNTSTVGYDPNQPPQNYQSAPQQPQQPNPNTTAGGHDAFGDWSAPPARNAGYPPPAQQRTNYSLNTQTGADPSGWGASIDTPTQGQLPPIGTVSNPQQPGSQTQVLAQPATQTNTWFPLVLVAAIGSIAWNFYLGMNYIDARNKYRAALRRSGKAYAEAFDDV